MDARLKIAKSYIRNITTKQDFITLLGSLMISNIEAKVMIDIYIHRMSIDSIACTLDYSCNTIKSIHKRTLLKVYNYLVMMGVVQQQ